MDRFAIKVDVNHPRVLLPEDVAILQALPFGSIEEAWREWENDWGPAGIRDLGKYDRYYLLTQILARPDAIDPWLYARSREVEAMPDDHLDLWAREHYKSTIITYAGATQEIILDPEITIGIFSHTKPIARAFLLQLKTEFEVNEYLKSLYPDVFYANPGRESPKWSEEKGIAVRRRSNPKEATVEAHGLTDGQPTSKHFKLRIYDDVVTLESVSTPDQVKKTTNAWSLSENLGAKGEDANGMPIRSRTWHIGTRYSFGDSYNEMIKMGAVEPRIHAATFDGTPSGELVMLTPEQWADKKKKMTAPILAAQMLQNPKAGNQAMFDQDMLRWADIRPKTLNVYILGDPARSKKKNTDKTAIAVVGMDATWNKYLLDGYHHRMNLRERWQALKNLYQKWSAEPGVQVVLVGWEDYGRINDIEYFEERMERDQIAFTIEELAWPNDGPGSKFDRIQRLVPDFQNGRFYLAYLNRDAEGKTIETKNQRKMREQGESFRILTPTMRADENGEIYSLNKAFLEQFLDYPFVGHEDLLDAVSRIYDINARPPTIIKDSDLQPDIFTDGV